MKIKNLHQLKKHTDRVLLTMLVLCSYFHLFAQPPAPTMDLKIEYEDIDNSYEVFFRSDVDINSATMIISQISIAIPSALTISDLTIDNSNIPLNKNWVVSNNVQEPAADSVYDYVSIKNTGGQIDAVAGSWHSFFEFSLTGGCHKGVRLFNNDDDPQATDPGMNNISFVNSINIIDNGTFLSPYRENKTGNSQIIFVDASASGSGTGESWNDANPNLSNAINNAECWKTEIWVAEGLYKPTNGVNRNSSFNIRNAMGIYGGFLGVETDRSERLGNSSNTVLSGDIGAIGVVADNSHNVVRINNRGLMPVVVDGFRVVDGQANHATTNARKRGGGIYVNKSNAIIRNCETEYNYCSLNGGGIYAYRSIVHIEGVVSVNNLAGNNGGGLFANRCNVHLSSSNLSNNTALNRGGGIYINRANAEVSSVILDENDAFRGGGAYCSNIEGSLFQALISNNSSSNNGSGVYLDKATSFSITNCTIADNFILEGTVGLKITNATSNIVVRNSILWNEGDEIDTQAGTFDIAFSNVEGGYIPGTNVFNLLPDFVEPGDYRLENTSPLLDLGLSVFLPENAEYDLDGSPRVAGLDVDLGVYENQVGTTLRKSFEEFAAEINVFPNPFVQRINLSCDADIFHTALIIDNAGHVLHNCPITSEDMQFNVDRYGSGLYHIVLISDKQNYSKTIVKI